ncbi:MAG: nucleoside hydrolase [Candidatus Dormibacteraeota bacterium]|nr:nucleoside hydrolase [Candidatus Dormibacteraeota bacterium]
MPRKIILDCDPGHDDAMAILLAHGNPEIELLAITTVAGNQTLEKTTLNARRVSTVAGIDLPIAAGCDRPLTRELRTAAYIHGESGLDGPAFGEPTVPVDGRHAVDLLIELVMSSSGDIALVPTGPLTNIAMAVRKEHRMVNKVQEIVLMGGAYTRGNASPAAEFNIAVDPEAAAIVFTAGWPLTMVGLDLTHQALATPAVLQRIAALGTPISKIAVQLMEFFRESYRRQAGFDAPPVHDPCAVARVIDATVMQCADAHVAIETRGEFTSGMTVTDFASGQPNAKVATQLDVDKFWDLMVDAIERIGAPAVRAD